MSEHAHGTDHVFDGGFLGRAVPFCAAGLERQPEPAAGRRGRRKAGWQGARRGVKRGRRCHLAGPPGMDGCWRPTFPAWRWSGPLRHARDTDTAAGRTHRVAAGQPARPAAGAGLFRLGLGAVPAGTTPAAHPAVTALAAGGPATAGCCSWSATTPQTWPPASPGPPMPELFYTQVRSRGCSTARGRWRPARPVPVRPALPSAPKSPSTTRSC